MQVYALLMVAVYPLGIPLMYIALLYRERGTLAIEQHQNLADKTRTYAIQKMFFGFRALNAVRHPDPAVQQAEDDEWEKLKNEHYLSFLISPYERRVYWCVVRREVPSSRLHLTPHSLTHSTI